MSVSFYLKRSSTASKRPVASALAYGELALNYDSGTGGIYYRDSSESVIKVGPAQVSNSAPNSTPSGSPGNSVGEFWYDTMTSALKVWDGSAWVATNTNSAYVANSAYTAKGVLLVGFAPSTPIAIAVGTDGYVLTADSGEASGLKWAAPAASGITSIIAGTGLTGGTITTTGTIALDTSGVSAGAYTFADITVDAYGRVTVAGNGADATTSSKGIVQVGTNIGVASGTISVADASTSTKGVVQLNNTTTSTSTSLALTAAQGKSLQDQIDALALTTNITLGGTFDANTGEVDSVTAAGTIAGLVVGSALPAAALANDQIFVIVDVQGSTGPSGAPPYHVGDWFLSDGSAWQFLNVGFAPGQATTVSQGVVQLATNAEVQAGTDSSNAVVSSSLQSKLSDSISTTSSSTIASSTAVKTAYDLANDALPKAGGTLSGQLYMSGANSIFFQNQGGTLDGITDSTSLTDDSIAASATAVKAAYDLANAALPKSAFTALGDLVVGTGSAAYVTLPAGSNGQLLSADSTTASGLKWVSLGGTGTVTSITAGTGLSGGTITTSGTVALANTAVTPGSYTNSSITVDAQGRLTAASSGTALVTGVTATSPITSSGGTAPVISTSMATNRLLGRSTAGTGVAEQITPGTNLTLSAGTLSAPAFATVSSLEGVNTTGTGTIGSTALTVASGSGISNGDNVSGVGILPGTTVSSGGGTTSLVLSNALVSTISVVSLNFTSPSQIVTPAVVAPIAAKATFRLDLGGYVTTTLNASPFGTCSFIKSLLVVTVTTQYDHKLLTGHWVCPTATTASGITLNTTYQVTVTGAKTFTITASVSGGTASGAISFSTINLKAAYNIHSVPAANLLGSTGQGLWIVNFASSIDSAYVPLIIGWTTATQGAAIPSGSGANSFSPTYIQFYTWRTDTGGNVGTPQIITGVIF